MAEPTLDTPADSVTVQIVNAVANETGCDPDTLPPLYSVVNPDALQSLMTCTPSITGDADAVAVTFEFADCTVTVSSTDGVVVSAGTAVSRKAAPMQTVDD